MIDTSSGATADPRSAFAPGPVALEVDNVSKSFGSINALEGVSLRIAAGRVTALVGDDGAGKSTLVKIMSGVLPPTAGSVRVDGRPVELRDPRAARQHGIHTVFQDLGLVGSLSIVENMFLCTEMRIRPWACAPRSSTAKPCGGCPQGSTISASRRSGTSTPRGIVSGGQRQSVAIARAVREQARVVILDEPTAALGVAQSAQVLRLMERLRASARPCSSSRTTCARSSRLGRRGRAAARQSGANLRDEPDRRGGSR